MKVYQTNEIRNLSFIGNAGSGKTTLAEAMIFEGGLISRIGDIALKTTVSDYRVIEQEQGGSISSTVLHTLWADKKINIIDTPGAGDFVGGVVSGLRVSDAAVLVLNAQNGIEVGTESAWRLTEKHHVPVIMVVNHLDHEKTNFEKTVDEIKERLSNKIAIIQFPVNQGIGFNSIVDVITMKMYTWDKAGAEPKITDIPESEKERATELHNALIESAAENDENLMEIFFEKGSLTEEEMRKGITKGLITGGMFPIFCTAARNNFGTRRLLDFLANTVPSPDLMPEAVTADGKNVKCDSKGKKSVYIFKNTIEQHLGEILFFKVMSGEIAEGDDLINMNKEAKERLSQLFAVNGKIRTKVEKLVAGDIGATIKLKTVKAQHTLCEKGTEFKFPPLEFPNPKYRTAIKAVSEADDEKLGEILHKLHDEDPTWILEYSKELKQLIIHGQGEHHLNTLKWYLDHEFKIAAEFIAPKIPYRETITKPSQADYRHKKQSGGAGQFGEVHLIIEPYADDKPAPKVFKINNQEYVVSVRDTKEFELPWGGKFIFYNCIVGGVIDASYMPAIIKGINEKMEFGPLTGSYARDIRVSVYFGKMHDVDSNEISFKLAGAKAFSEAFKKASPKLLEPVYDVDVMVPGDRMGDVMSDLQGRRAIIMGMSSIKGFEVIKARIPLAELNKYSTTLSSLTGGRATYEMAFAEYAQVPTDIQEKLIKEHEAELGEE